MDLKEIILNEEREKAAVQDGWGCWYEASKHPESIALKNVEIISHVRALDRIDSVMRWAATEMFIYSEQRPGWYQKHSWSIVYTDAELLQLYKEKNG